ncbi:uncharacterized protein VP01_1424g4 [Puccinia sorghi]|uniref:Dihydrofolate synthetase n=1 Tax=Puccinia sorghi TaxID=27349 RepID=A0A0L6VKL1_9BASI|nr:uncharacterized protein VP01_1424g4 [Puccinia sorghi]
MSIRLGLERVSKVLQCLGNPHLNIPVIHVAGTNGKGSVCAYQTEILRCSGYNVGRFTSPFLRHPTDSVNINGANVDRQIYQEAHVRIHTIARQNRIQLTAFELLTVIAFELFARPSFQLDLAVIEVGLGGLKDSTNVCRTSNTLLSCITPISIDHQVFLGSSIPEITAQKVGIAKPHVPILLAQQSFPQVEQIVRTRASLESCDLFTVRPYPIPQDSTQSLPPLPLMPVEQLPSDPHPNMAHSSKSIPNPLSPTAGFQHQNVATAVTLTHLIRTHPHPLKLLPSLAAKVTDQAIIEGLQKTHWQGRLELTRYRGAEVLLDGAHNVAAAKLLGRHILSLHRPITLVFSLSSTRDPSDMIEALDLSGMSPPVQLIATPFSVPEDMQWVSALDPDLIAHHFRRASPHTATIIRVAQDAAHALSLALSLATRKDELIVVCGSLYLISDVLRIINCK